MREAITANLRNQPMDTRSPNRRRSSRKSSWKAVLDRGRLVDAAIAMVRLVTALLSLGPHR